MAKYVINNVLLVCGENFQNRLVGKKLVTCTIEPAILSSNFNN